MTTAHPRAPRLVLLYSPAPGSGKSTLADYLVEQHGFTAIKFADPLKDLIRVLLFDHCGIDHATTERYVDGDLKEVTIPELGVTSRHLQQTIGTDWMRDRVRKDGWVHIARQRIARLLASGQDVVVDDMRFPNELEMGLDFGGQAFRIERRGTLRNTKHVSEGGLDDVPMQVIHNDGTIADLALAVDRVLGYA